MIFIETSAVFVNDYWSDFATANIQQHLFFMAFALAEAMESASSFCVFKLNERKIRSITQFSSVYKIPYTEC